MPKPGYSHRHNQATCTLGATINFQSCSIHPLSPTGIWLEYWLNGISIESKNTENGVRTKKLWPSEIGGHDHCVLPGIRVLVHFEFLSPRVSEFGYNYFPYICSPISLVYPIFRITQFGCVMAKLWPNTSMES